MSSRELPPVRHLPHWTRVGRLGKTSFPQRGAANRLQPLPSVQQVDTGLSRGAVTSGGSDTDPRVASLRRNIEFLQKQHRETLEKLHDEVDYLRRENKELQYRLIMEPPKSGRKETRPGQTSTRNPAQGIENLARSHFVEPLTGARLQGQHLSARAGIEDLSSSQDQGSPLKDGIITSLQPLRIHRNPSQQPHPPTLPECEVIIRQLYNTNCLQSQEIARVKNLLREIVLNRRITPEHHTLTKAYVSNGTSRKLMEDKKPGPQALSEKMTESRLILPVLTQSINSTADKQRRPRAVQRDRSKAPVR